MKMNKAQENTVSIRPIDKGTIHRICSGQVVLNLATAVKELIENSIDAGATAIQVKLEEYGSDSIEVIDNGCGVEEVNFQALTLKHHTSKISDFNDVCNVQTFGFRGEALSSLCALSDVTIITQHKSATIGAILKFNHQGTIIHTTKTLRKCGTTVKLQNLFCTLPVRRTEFMKNLKREFAKLCNILYSYGLQTIGIRITCTNHLTKMKTGNKESKEDASRKGIVTTVMDTKGDTVESNIRSIFGLKQKQNIIKIEEKYPSQSTLSEFGLENRKLDFDKFNLEGYISSCAHGCGRNSADRQFYYVNSRPVDNPKISKLVNEIYHQFNNRQDPFVMLNIKVASGSFDVNVTPDKRQILIQNEKILLATLKESLLSLFQNIPSTLELQNVGLFGSKVCSGDNFHENPRTKPKVVSLEKRKREEAVLRIDKLLKFKRKCQELSAENGALKTLTSEPESTAESVPCISDCANEIVPSVESPEIVTNLESVDSTQNDVPILDDSTANVKVTPIVAPHNEECKGRTTNDNPSFSSKPKFRITIEEIGEGKRKQNESFPDKYLSNQSPVDNSEHKRMKFDEGLTEEEKNRKRCVIVNTNLSLLKEMMLEEKDRDKGDKAPEPEVKFLAEIKPQCNERAELELKKVIKKENFSKMEIIGQFNLGFIIAKLDFDIFIIDQHASDEKYNYETIRSNTVIQSQQMVNPERLELTIDKEELMVQHEHVFKENGFDFIFEETGTPTRRIKLTAVPLSKNITFGHEDVDELLFLLEDAPEKTMLRPTRMERMFASRACRKSVMIGTALNVGEMRKIVDHMGEIEQPWNCPHGRPTMRHLVNLQMISLDAHDQTFNKN